MPQAPSLAQLATLGTSCSRLYSRAAWRTICWKLHGGRSQPPQRLLVRGCVGWGCSALQGSMPGGRSRQDGRVLVEREKVGGGGGGGSEEDMQWGWSQPQLGPHSCSQPSFSSSGPELRETEPSLPRAVELAPMHQAQVTGERSWGGGCVREGEAGGPGASSSLPPRCSPGALAALSRDGALPPSGR